MLRGQGLERAVHFALGPNSDSFFGAKPQPFRRLTGRGLATGGLLRSPAGMVFRTFQFHRGDTAVCNAHGATRKRQQHRTSGSHACGGFAQFGENLRLRVSELNRAGGGQRCDRKQSD